MRVEFELLTKAFSVNATYGASKRFKTREFVEWELAVSGMLDEVKDLTDLADAWRQAGGEFSVEFKFRYPHHAYYNKQGEISAKTFDLSNVEKPLLDQIFGGRMSVNDRYVTQLHSSKDVGPTHSIAVIIHLHPKAA